MLTCASNRNINIDFMQITRVCVCVHKTEQKCCRFVIGTNVILYICTMYTIIIGTQDTIDGFVQSFKKMGMTLTLGFEM